jgi:cysteine rich repeat protein
MNRSTIAGLTVIFCLATAATTTFSAAQQPDMQKLQWVPEMRAAINACMADQQRLCPDVVPGNGRIVRCLAAQGGRLSYACASAMQKASDALVAAGVMINPGMISQ